MGKVKNVVLWTKINLGGPKNYLNKAEIACFGWFWVRITTLFSFAMLVYSPQDFFILEYDLQVIFKNREIRDTFPLSKSQLFMLIFLEQIQGKI